MTDAANDPGIDIGAYFARIGYAGAPKPDLATLTAIHGRHVRTIPFENLNPLLALPVEIDLAALTAKLVHGRRGGYCFEQNGLLYAVLARIGYDVTPLSARVIWNAPADGPRTPLSHRITKVVLPQGDFLVDVGFGGQSPTVPLRFEVGSAQQTPHGQYRLIEAGPALELQMNTSEGWRGMYRFTQEPQAPMDYEVANWFTSTNPRSRFRQNLMTSLLVGDRRMNLLNRSLTIWEPDGQSQSEEIESAAALGARLTDTFGLALPATADEIWARLPA